MTHTSHRQRERLRVSQLLLRCCCCYLLFDQTNKERKIQTGPSQSFFYCFKYCIYPNSSLSLLSLSLYLFLYHFLSLLQQDIYMLRVQSVLYLQQIWERPTVYPPAEPDDEQEYSVQPRESVTEEEPIIPAVVVPGTASVIRDISRVHTNSL